MNSRKIYLSPKIEMLIINLEKNIATGSAKVNPGDANQQVKQEWEDGDNDYRVVEW